MNICFKEENKEKENNGQKDGEKENFFDLYFCGQ